MTSIRSCFLLAFAMSAFCVTAYALALPAFQFERVEKASEWIIAVEVLEVKENGTLDKVVDGAVVPCSRCVATCKVLSVLKEKDHTASPITVHFLQAEHAPLGFLGFEEVTEGETAILFLKNEAEGQMVFVRDQYAKIPLDGHLQITAHKDASVREGIGRLLVGGIEDKSADTVDKNVTWANTIGYQVPKDVLLLLAKKPDPNVRAIALTQLVRTEKDGFVNEAVSLLLHGDQLIEMYRAKLAWALAQSAQQVPVSQANQLAASTNATVARFGLRILGTVGDESSVSVLVEGLDAKSKDAQYNAVAGLCRVTGQRGPPWREFMQNPDAEIGKWKEWWRERGKTEERK